ncbi:MAG: acetyl-CoA carboxylase, carboxyltransferase subunit beta [Sphingomonadaceae bacterium]|nr:acetyl-CoA carboxylase, carboxyltransferase subunit beta [Sphingomonadaceae bacterium]
MSWLTRQRAALGLDNQKRETPDDLWVKCAGCGEMLYRKEFVASLSVCPKCGHHHRIRAADRFAQTFDGGVHSRLPSPGVAADPLRFIDTKPYPDRLQEARRKTGETDAFALAQGLISGVQTIVGVQDFAFMGGSMGMAVGEAFIAGARAALAARAPYVVFTAAGGARMQEGALSLMQMPRTTVAIAELREAALPYLVVMTDPTTGGVTASYAMLGDVQIAEPGALIGFAGARVIEQTIREKLPPGFQRAEYLLEHGFLDMVVQRPALASTLGRLLRLLTKAPAAAA